MEKKRKIIGVFLCEGENFYPKRVLDGITEMARKLDINVAVFSTPMHDINSLVPSIDPSPLGDVNIFNLANFDILDGIIVLPLTFYIKGMREIIEKSFCQSRDIPIIYLDDFKNDYPTLLSDDVAAIEKITDHLIEHHNYRKLMFLGGPKENPSTILRVQGFINSCKKHNIEVTDDAIWCKGDYWYSGGERLARELIEGKYEMPQAVVAASDYMAIGFQRELLKNNIYIPRDIAVTGFDATDDAINALPSSITSFTPSSAQNGAKAVAMIYEKIYNRPCEKHINTNDNKFEIGASCGCQPDINYLKRGEMYNLMNSILPLEYFLTARMQEMLATARTLQGILRVMSGYLFFLQKYEKMFICLCDNWDGSKNNFLYSNSDMLTVGYTKSMTEVYRACHDENGNECISYDSPRAFDTSLMHPLLFESEKQICLFFTPAHYNEYCLGYYVITYDDRCSSYDAIYRYWNGYMNIALEIVRMQSKLLRYSAMDALTGLFNRIGLSEQVKDLYVEVTKNDKIFVITMIDMDGLKIINDVYGHLEGDSSICAIAKCVQKASKETDICARIGGDEFLIIGCVPKNKENGEITEFRQRFNDALDSYNSLTKKPYKLSASIGSFIGVASNEQELDLLIHEADRIMYEVKKEHKRKSKTKVKK